MLTCSRPSVFPRLFVLLGLAAVWLAAAPSAHAQSSGNGTYYSRYGLGEINDYHTSQSEALGGGAFALRSFNYALLANPALLSDQVLTRAVVGAHVEQVIAENAAGETSRLASGQLDVVQFSLPLISRRLGLGLSYQPFARSDFRVQSDDILVTPSLSPDTVGVEVGFEGQGGLQQLSAGLGYRLSDALSVGVTADVFFGILEDVRTTRFESDRYQPTTLTNATRLSGVTATLGLQYSVGGVLADEDALSFGAAVTLPTSLTGERERAVGEDLLSEELATEDGSVTLPWRARAGLAYQPDDRWIVVIDGLYAPWSTLDSDFASDGAPGLFPTGGTNTMRDRWRVSSGAEFLPAGNDFNAGFLARTGYRVGVYAERLYVSPVAGTTVYETAVTGGLSLPTALFGTRVDFNAHVGQRGETGSGLIRDLFYGFSLSFNVGERWFQERVLR